MSLSSVVSKFSPALGSILNLFIPGSSLILSAITSAFGLPAGSDEGTIAATVASDPDAGIKLAKIEADHKDAILNMETQIRLGAYNREIEVTKATGHTDHTMNILAFSFVGGFFAYVFLLLFVHIDATAHDIVLLLAGQISGMALTIGNYYFGSMMKSHAPPVKNEVHLPPPAQTR